VAVEGVGVGQDLDANVAGLAVDVGQIAAGSSWTKAAVFWRNIGMSGTPSMTLRVAATAVPRS